jgi:hypothetical protein
MIKLSGNFITTQQTLSGTTVSSSVVTDTLFVTDVRMDFITGALYATIQRGTLVNGVFTSNYQQVQITVNPDGSFVSSDGSWKGTLSSIATLVAGLKSQFDAFVLASGLVTGTAV